MTYSRADTLVRSPKSTRLTLGLQMVPEMQPISSLLGETSSKLHAIEDAHRFIYFNRKRSDAACSEALPTQHGGRGG